MRCWYGWVFSGFCRYLAFQGKKFSILNTSGDQNFTTGFNLRTDLCITDEEQLILGVLQSWKDVLLRPLFTDPRSVSLQHRRHTLTARNFVAERLWSCGMLKPSIYGVAFSLPLTPMHDG